MISNNQIRPVARVPSIFCNSAKESAEPDNPIHIQPAINPVQSICGGFGNTSALRDSILARCQSGDSKQSGSVQEVFTEQFSNLAADPEAFHSLLQDVYGDSYDVQAGEKIRQHSLAGNFSWIPDIKFVDAAVLGGGQGAYDSANDTILILADLKGTAQGGAVFTEEVGHALDNRLNTSDTAGDEGELFKMLISGEKLTTEQRQAILLDNDHGSIVVDGKEVAVEYSWWSDNITKPWNDHVVDPLKEHILDPIVDFAQSIRDITVDLLTFPLELGQIATEGLGNFVAALADGDFSAAGQAIVDSFVDSFHAAGGQITDTVLMGLHAVVNLIESTLGLIEERPLSQAEIDYLRPIFGNSINYRAVTVQSGGIKESLNMRPNVVGNDIFMSEELFLDGGPGLTKDGLVILSHEMGHIWQFQNRGPEYIHTALADQHNHGSQGVGSGGAYDWLFIADQGVSFNNMGPESQAELASFIGQIIHPRTGQLNGDMANNELREIFGNEYWMSPETWAIVKNAHITLLNE